MAILFSFINIRNRYMMLHNASICDLHMNLKEFYPNFFEKDKNKINKSKQISKSIKDYR